MTLSTIITCDPKANEEAIDLCLKLLEKAAELRAEGNAAGVSS